MPALKTVAAAAPADECILWRARGDIVGGMHRGPEVGAVASTMAVWWGMRLSSLVMHLFKLCASFTYIFFFTFFLAYLLPYLSIPSRIDPLRFQARGRKRRPNLGFFSVLVYVIAFLHF